MHFLGFIVVILIGSFQPANAETHCETESQKALVTFMELIHKTSVGSAKIELMDQYNDDLIFKSVFRIEYMGSMWGDTLVEVTADLDNYCLVSGVQVLD